MNYFIIFFDNYLKFIILKKNELKKKTIVNKF